MTGRPPRLHDYLDHILQAIGRIRRYTAGTTLAAFIQDELLQDAVIRNIEILGEAAKRIETEAPQVVAEHAEIPWSALYAMRNRVAHGYWSVDLERVWMVIQRDISELEAQIRALADGTRAR